MSGGAVIVIVLVAVLLGIGIGVALRPRRPAPPPPATSGSWAQPPAAPPSAASWSDPAMPVAPPGLGDHVLQSLSVDSSSQITTTVNGRPVQVTSGGLTELPPEIAQQVQALMAGGIPDASLHPPGVSGMREQVVQTPAGARTQTTLTAAMQPAAIAAWYQANLPQQGWQAASPGVFTRGAERLSVSLPAAPGADGTVTWTALHERPA